MSLPKVRTLFVKLFPKYFHSKLHVGHMNINKEVVLNTFCTAATCTPPLLSATSKKLVSLDICSERLIQELATIIDLSSEDLYKIFSQHRIVSRIPVETWKVLFEFFENQGMLSEDVKDCLLACPELLELDLNHLRPSFLWWRTLKLGEGRLLKVIHQCPHLLLLKVPELQHREKQLNSVFNNSDILELAETCPQAFFEPWNEILAKVQYVLHTVGLDQHHIIKSKALKYSLTHIENRHQFLLRAGLFLPIKAGTDLRSLKNPSLTKVINSRDGDFVKLSGLSLEEYRTFCSVMEQERKNNLLEASGDLDDV